MNQPVSAFYKLVAAANVEDDTIVFDIAGAKGFKLTKFIVGFPSGTDGELEISCYRGLEKIIPYSGVLTGDNMSYEIVEEEDFSGESEVKVHFKNLNASTAKTAYILLTGELG
jgi:hypothetical protein